MADAPGKDTPPTDPKPTAKTGPVKPPVLEGNARPVNEGKPAEKPQPAKPETGKPAAAADKLKPGPASPAEPNSSGIWAVAFGGGLVGLAAAYGLAFFGLWPATPQSPPPADPRLGQFATTIPELQTVTNTVQDELATLTSRVGRLETDIADLPSPSAAAPMDTNALDQRLDALSARIDQIGSAPVSAENPVDLTEVNADIAALRSEVESLRQEAAQTASGLGTAQSQIATLSEQAGAAATTESDMARLPLIFSGLESAFAAGRPYEDVLAALRRAQPDATIPAEIADNAGSGLPRPDDVARRVQELVPDMLAGRPISADTGWQDAGLDWFRGLVAMRPAEALEGSGPEASVARLEHAVARRDFVAAQSELDSLPQPMRNAATPVAGDIATLAAANSFLDTLRARALTQESAE